MGAEYSLLKSCFTLLFLSSSQLLCFPQFLYMLLGVFFLHLKYFMTHTAQQRCISFNVSQHKIWNTCLQSFHQNPFGYITPIHCQLLMKCFIKVPLWAIVCCSSRWNYSELIRTPICFDISIQSISNPCWKKQNITEF